MAFKVVGGRLVRESFKSSKRSKRAAWKARCSLSLHRLLRDDEYFARFHGNPTGVNFAGHFGRREQNRRYRRAQGGPGLDANNEPRA